jgi:enolase
MAAWEVTVMERITDVHALEVLDSRGNPRSKGKSS